MTASIAPVVVNAPAVFARCTLAGRPVPNPIPPRPGIGLASSAVLVHGTDMLLTDTTVTAALSENEVVIAVTAAGGRVFADAPVQIVSRRLDPITAAGVEAAPATLLNIAQDEHFRVLQEVCFPSTLTFTHLPRCGYVERR